MVRTALFLAVGVAPVILCTACEGGGEGALAEAGVWAGDGLPAVLAKRADAPCTVDADCNPPSVCDAASGRCVLDPSLLLADWGGGAELCWPFATKFNVCGFNCYSGHKGADIAAPCGTKLFSPVSGKVDYVKNDYPGQDASCKCYGNYVRILSQGFTVYLAHLQKGSVVVQPGQTVSQGQYLGLTGNTGMTWGKTGCHLHLELRNAYGPVDPTKGYFKPGCYASGVVGPAFACKYAAQNPSGSGPTAITAGQERKVEITFTNTGTTTWVRDTAKGVSNPAHLELWACNEKGTPAASAFAHTSWINTVRVTALDPALQSYVAPGQTARFPFTVRAPATAGVRRLYVIPTLAGKASPSTCFAGAHFYFDVKASTCSGSSSQACGNCGKQTRTCSAGKWSAWSSCTGQGVCKPGSTKPCAGGGSQQCSKSCAWEPCPPPAGCSGPSSQACGNCGKQTRTCSGGKWSAWSSCTGQGVCKPKSTGTCGAGSTKACSTKCQWEDCKGTVDVYRFSWNGVKAGQARRDHFYQLIKTVPPGYKADNNGKPVFRTFGNAYGGKMKKLWRLYYGGNCMDHYYTVDTAEKNKLVSQGWKLDNPDNIGHCSGTKTAGSVPLYQTYCANLCDHLYTVNKVERDLSITNGYNTSIRTICYVWNP